MNCDYCHKPARLTTGREIYSRRMELWRKKIWFCSPCQAWVGCHDGTEKPLGRLANAELRQAKIQAHAAFDPLWQRGGMSRREAYGLLSAKMGIPREDTHIGMFDLEQCRKVIEVLREHQRPTEAVFQHAVAQDPAKWNWAPVRDAAIAPWE